MEVAELQTRLALEEQRDEERGKEAFALKQKLTDAEMARDSLKKEVRMEKSHVTHSLNFTKTFSLFPRSSRRPRSACWSLRQAGGAARGS